MKKKEIIRQLYFNHISERDLGKILVFREQQLAIAKISLKKLKKFFEF
jgi:hypothetical protein